MIERITIADCASYGSQAEQLINLKPINFLYGPNAAGKTTISRIVSNPNPTPPCAVHWEHGTRLETLVYNRDFVSTNFSQTSELKGIFTLGQKDIETQNKIAAAKTEVDELARKIEQLTETLQGTDGTGGKIGEMNEIELRFRDECWDVKSKHDAKLQGAMAGYRGDKQKFKDRLINECNKPPCQPVPLGELEVKAESVFGPAPTTEYPLTNLSEEAFLMSEADKVLKKRVIGKADVDIAAMIQQLGNSDWVRQGVPYLEMSDGKCPFCQQKAPEQLAASLAEYFDETFAQDTKAIADVQAAYGLEGERIQQTLQAAISSSSRFLDIEKLKSEKFIFDSRFQLCKQRLETKAKEPSQLVTLEPLGDVLATAKQIIAEANEEIRKHNSVVANLASEKALLTSKTWAYFANTEIKPMFAKYTADKSKVEMATQAISENISAAQTERNTKEDEIRSLERNTTSVRPTVNEINKILKAFGFTNFSIEATESNRYKILRQDGSDAKNTLSEGEQSFITFLYFFHLLKGSNSDSGMTRDRVVVFDDPVSSLDSDVLFIVSSLIKRAIEEVRANQGNTKQIFVLTHNVYFYKEITFNQRRSGSDALNDETFWTIRKVNGCSTIHQHKKNPITTGYDLLWSEVREPNPTSQTIQNTLRRILEDYFRILGGMSPDDIVGYFDGEEKLICKSLLSWMSEGSHAVPDDVFLAADANTIQKYLEVFKMIFVRLGHESHYNMMIGSIKAIETAVASPPA